MRNFPDPVERPGPDPLGEDGDDPFFSYPHSTTEERERDKKVGLVMAYGFVGLIGSLLVFGVFWVIAMIVKVIFL